MEGAGLWKLPPCPPRIPFSINADTDAWRIIAIEIKVLRLSISMSVDTGVYGDAWREPQNPQRSSYLSANFFSSSIKVIK